jgi:hypothetical protein
MNIVKEYSWRIKGKFQSGTSVKVQGRNYIALGTEPYVNKAGRKTQLIVWRGNCTLCGDEFTFKTGRSFTAFAKCDVHRKSIPTQAPIGAKVSPNSEGCS